MFSITVVTWYIEMFKTDRADTFLLEHVLFRNYKPTFGRLRASSIDRFLVAMLRAALDIL